MSNSINNAKTIDNPKEMQAKEIKALADIQKKLENAIQAGISSGLPEASLKMIEDIISSVEKIDGNLAAKLSDKLKGIIDSLKDAIYSDNNSLQDISSNLKDIQNIMGRNDLQGINLPAEIEKTQESKDYDPFKSDNSINVSL